MAHGIATFSIVAADPARGECGVATASKALAVGSIVPWARGGIGAVATQSDANTTFGPVGLELLAAGLSPDEVMQRLIAGDPEPAERQVGIVDMQARASTFTGSNNWDWSGGLIGPGVAVQGNLLVSEETATAMLHTFQGAEGPLAIRLLEALAAGDRAGGDRRGRQSAALLVVKPGGGFMGWNDRLVDLRVDDHPNPIDELRRLYGLWKLRYDPESPDGG
jgi:uncharacterized Ntn-hydrolase superfamily protein